MVCMLHFSVPSTATNYKSIHSVGSYMIITSSYTCTHCVCFGKVLPNHKVIIIIILILSLSHAVIFRYIRMYVYNTHAQMHARTHTRTHNTHTHTHNTHLLDKANFIKHWAHMYSTSVCLV